MSRPDPQTAGMGDAAGDAVHGFKIDGAGDAMIRRRRPIMPTAHRGDFLHEIGAVEGAMSDHRDKLPRTVRHAKPEGVDEGKIDACRVIGINPSRPADRGLPSDIRARNA